MKERPILFSAPMVRAILAGTKTQTRRAIKTVGNDGGFVLVEQDDGSYWPRRSDDGESIFVTVRERGKEYVHEIPMACPYGAPGDRLWVRETWAAPHNCDHLKPSEIDDGWRIHYAATEDRGGLLWRPSIFMPRWASRITLEVTDVRVERLQAISYEDAVAEGIDHEYPKARAQYRDLWESINGTGSWAANPWVWVVELTRATESSNV